MAYKGPISTLPGKDLWCNVDEETEQIGVPNTLRPRGRPRKNRMKNFLESGKKRTKAAHKCGRCGGWGHHKSTCKSPIMQATSQLPEVIEEITMTGEIPKERGYRQKF